MLKSLKVWLMLFISSLQPLQDPKSLKEKEMSDSKKKSLDMDETLAPLHGSKSFKDFVEKKGTRMPEVS